MFASIFWRAAAFVAFTGFGIAWASHHSDALAVLWVLSFVWLVATTLWYSLPEEERLRVSGPLAVIFLPPKRPDA